MTKSTIQKKRNKPVKKKQNMWLTNLILAKEFVADEFDS